ncbi:alpha/beta hydrolase [Geminocystis sp. GBBB08]|uniref:alpha/beta fold hydrolase n=1 Tax=Geminocystis sp. GBBB08 TaxID=2604140 RepID=UPI0027E21D43|nr:alpha/beta hydrolase [Geminocystis sp. GBBB08]MBL1211457.1 alpha/beta hydrolase [Geminocystis sp. GBBB08]
MIFLPSKTLNTRNPLFIYLPGLDGSGKLLKNQTQIWEHFDVRCVAIPPNHGIEWPELTQQLVTLIQEQVKIHDDREIYLCGESFGACLAMTLMEKIPNLFTKVILINSASAFHERPWLNWGTYITQIMPDWIYRGSTLLLLPFLAKLEALNLRERQRLLRVMALLPPHIVSWRISLLAKFFLNQNKLNEYQKDVLIVASREDQLLPSLKEAERLNSIFTHSKITILPHSGHCCLLEKGVNLLQIIKKY